MASRGKKYRPKFPVAEIHTMLSGDDPIEKVDPRVPVFIEAVQEYVAHEMLELVCNDAVSRGNDVVAKEDFIAVIKDDAELYDLFQDIIDNEINADQ